MPYCTKCGKLIPDEATFCPNCGAPVPGKVSAIPTPPPSTPPLNTPISGIDAIVKNQQAQNYWIRRLVALVIDAVVIAIIVGVAALIIFIPYLISQIAAGQFFTTLSAWFNFFSFPLIVGIGLILYFPLSEITWGATLGKSIMGLKVTRSNGERPTLGQAFIRNISKIYWILLLLDVVIGLATQTDYKQKFSDRYAGTVVVSTR
ncbi:MAG: RDD family protein [Nitrososphaeria archaeon]|jgi:uncharacterized RDD family membrane protein YckC